METSNNLFGFEQIDIDIKVDSTLIFEEIRKELKEYLPEQSVNSNSTDGVFDLLATLSDIIQEEFEELLKDDSKQKPFLRAQIRIFTILLNTKVITPVKIKKILETAVKTVIKLRQGQN